MGERGLGFKLLMEVTEGREGDPIRARASSKDPLCHQLIICCLVCDWQVSGGSLPRERSFNFLWHSLPLLKLTQPSGAGFVVTRSPEGPSCQPNSVQPHARLTTKVLIFPCSGKAFLCGRNWTIQTTNQPTSQPLPLSAASNLDAAHAGEPRYPSLGKTHDP